MTNNNSLAVSRGQGTVNSEQETVSGEQGSVSRGQ